MSVLARTSACECQTPRDHEKKRASSSSGVCVESAHYISQPCRRTSPVVCVSNPLGWGTWVALVYTVDFWHAHRPIEEAVHVQWACALGETLPGPWYVVCVTVRTPNSGRRTSCAVWRRRQCTFWQTVTAFFWPSHPSCARCRCATNLMSRDMGNRPRRMRTSQPARR